MPRIKLTAAAVERLQAPAEGQIDYFDAAYPALALRVTAKGVRSWVYFGRVHGKLKRATLGRYPDLKLRDARVKAGETADDMRSGIDPAAVKRAARKEPRDKDTVEYLAEQWLKRDQSENRTYREVARIMNREVLPAWRGRRIQTITRRDVIDLIDGVRDRGAKTLALRVHARLHRFFRWCAGRDIIEVSPMADLPKPGKEVKRDRVLDDNELREVWCAAENIGYPFGPAIKLLILTGARREEISALKWAEVDHDKSVIRLDDTRTKNAIGRAIPLSPTALSIIKSLPHISDDKGQDVFAFTTTGRTPVSGWSRAKNILDAKLIDARREAHAGAEAETVEALPRWVLHDLRRSVATGLQKLGFRLEVVEAVLGHVSGSRAGVVGIYQRHTFDDEKRLALDAWGKHVAGLVEGESAQNVVALRGA